jgi:hypothetical protein
MPCLILLYAIIKSSPDLYFTSAVFFFLLSLGRYTLSTFQRHDFLENCGKTYGTGRQLQPLALRISKKRHKRERHTSSFYSLWGDSWRFSSSFLCHGLPSLDLRGLSCVWLVVEPSSARDIRTKPGFPARAPRTLTSTGAYVCTHQPPDNSHRFFLQDLGQPLLGFGYVRFLDQFREWRATWGVVESPGDQQCSSRIRLAW